MTASPPVTRHVTFLAAVALCAMGAAVGSLALRRDAPRIHAATAAADDAFAACTAPMDGEVEGLFLLDFETGDLSGCVLTRNTGKFTATYRHNVLKDLEFKAGKVKNPKFLLTTGVAEFAGNAGTNMAQSVLYVTDASTGVSVAYAIPWNAQAAAAGAPLSSQFIPLDRIAPRGGKAK